MLSPGLCTSQFGAALDQVLDLVFQHKVICVLESTTARYEHVVNHTFAIQLNKAKPAVFPKIISHFNISNKFKSKSSGFWPGNILFLISGQLGL